MMRTLHSTMAAVLCMVALACAAAEASRERAQRELASSDAAVRRAGAAHLGEVGRMSDVSALVKALRDRDEETRAIAETAIWEIWGRSGDARIDALFAKGVALMGHGAARAAIEVFTQIIAQKPDFAEGWNKRATVYYTIGEYEKSLRDCDEVIKRNPLHFGALSGYGLIYTQLGETGRAVEYFRRALSINPNMPGVQHNIELLEQQMKTKRRSYI